MRKLLLLPCLFLIGCSSLTSSYYNATEHNMVLNLTKTAFVNIKKCDSRKYIEETVLPELENQSISLFFFVRTRTDDETETSKSADALVSLVDEMKERYLQNSEVSKAYCEGKLRNIFIGSYNLLEAVAKKPKSGVM